MRFKIAAGWIELKINELDSEKIQKEEARFIREMLLMIAEFLVAKAQENTPQKDGPKPLNMVTQELIIGR